jgi:hypothetical protein
VRESLESGGSSSGIPINTLYAMPALASPSTSKSNLLLTGTNHDTLYTTSWTVLLVGRVLVESDSDLANAYGLEKQIQLTPLSKWQTGSGTSGRILQHFQALSTTRLQDFAPSYATQLEDSQ